MDRARRVVKAIGGAVVPGAATAALMAETEAWLIHTALQAGIDPKRAISEAQRRATDNPYSFIDACDDVSMEIMSGIWAGSVDE